jgi:signal transduction histidine kinase
VAAPIEPGAACRRDDKVNILLVDDQPARLMSYESILSELGQNLVMARSGLEALERLMASEFAVVLLDVNMPGMDGFETASLIHEHPRFEKTPIIFVTGVHVSELDRLQGYQLGAVDYVSIPVVPEILRSKVAVLVELYCQRRELQQLNQSLAEANTALAQANSTLQAEKNRELEELNTTLRDANRLKDEFLAMLAHELRNPLAPIHNAVQLMRNPVLPAAQFGWARDVIERQVGHLTRLVDDLLDVSRITRGKINVNRESLEVSTVVARAVETVQPMLVRQKHELVLNVDPAPMYVEGDLTRLTQIVGNILSNAIKYTDAGGRIELSAGAVEDLVEIRVCDNGIGIEQASLPAVFDLFTQASRVTERTQAGLGIGLALVKRLVELHGGQVEARSEGLGRGSEFIVRLPRQVRADSTVVKLPAAATTDGATPDATPDATATVRRILVADDNRDALDSLVELLAMAGHETHKAGDGPQALEAATRLRPEVILLDIGMPGLDGYEVARQIRAQSWGRQPTLVALTGWGQDNDRKRSSEAGFDAHWVKPLELHRLWNLLESLPDSAAVEAAARVGTS